MIRMIAISPSSSGASEWVKLLPLRIPISPSIQNQFIFYFICTEPEKGISVRLSSNFEWLVLYRTGNRSCSSLILNEKQFLSLSPMVFLSIFRQLLALSLKMCTVRVHALVNWGRTFRNFNDEIYRLLSSEKRENEQIVSAIMSSHWDTHGATSSSMLLSFEGSPWQCTRFWDWGLMWHTGNY